MTAYIRYCAPRNIHPEQIQGIRMISVYPVSVNEIRPELVIHFKEQDKPSKYIPMQDILAISIMED